MRAEPKAEVISLEMQHDDLELLPTLEPELAILVATLHDGAREWRENLESPSLDAIVWSPYPNGPSIGGVLLHVAAAERYWIQKVAAGIDISLDDPAWAYDTTMDQYGPSWPVPPAEPIEWYFDIQDRTRAEMIDLIVAHNNRFTIYQHHDYTVTYGWIVAHIVQHDSYHGGQAVLLHEMFKKLMSAN
ncbi:MAG: DinB family protein [Fimbriimonas sp.]